MGIFSEKARQAAASQEAETKRSATRAKNQLARKEQLLAEYNAADTKCNLESCNNLLRIDQWKDGGRYCCLKCSNSAIPRRIKATPEELERKRILSSEKAKERRKLIPVKVRNVNRKDYENCCEVCDKLFLAKGVRKTCSPECLQKQRSSKASWKVRTVEPSYAEQYFISVFENEGISGWTREKNVGKWFVDFAFDDLMIAVEVDGHQHDYPERKASDEVKDKFLFDLGWKVIRIKWKNPRTEKGKSFLHPQVKALIELLQKRA